MTDFIDGVSRRPPPAAMRSEQSTTATPGWYQDPASSSRMRFFDGTSWTAKVMPKPSTSSSASGPARPVFQPTPDPYQPRPRPTAPLAPAPAPVSVLTSPPQPTRSLPRDPTARFVESPGKRPLVTHMTPSSAHHARRRGLAVFAFMLILVSTGVLVSAFWDSLGSDFYQRSAQDELAASLSAHPPSQATSTLSGAFAAIRALAPELTPQAASVQTAAGAPVDAPVLPQPLVIPDDGLPAGRLVIPSIGVDQIVVGGTTVDALKKGPGIWRPGVFPGEPGNATISGHRTTYGGPFRHLDQLHNGDLITFQVPGHQDFVFEVRGTATVRPSEGQVTYQTPGVRLTLTTCDPVGSDAQRLVVQAELVSGETVSAAIPANQWQLQR